MDQPEYRIIDTRSGNLAATAETWSAARLAVVTLAREAHVDPAVFQTELPAHPEVPTLGDH